MKRMIHLIADHSADRASHAFKPLLGLRRPETGRLPIPNERLPIELAYGAEGTIDPVMPDVRTPRSIVSGSITYDTAG